MKWIFTIFLLFLSGPSFSGGNYEYLLKIINNELSEVTRLNKQIQASDSMLLLRMSELYLERGRVKKEQENERFLKISPAKRRRISKKRFLSNKEVKK